MSELWTPERAAEGLALAPMRGRFRLQIGYPDNPHAPGEVEDTGWLDNAVLTFVPWLLWCMLGGNPNGGPGDRFFDGANIGPSLAEMFTAYQTAASVNLFSQTAANTSNTSPWNLAAAAAGFSLLNGLMGGLALGNYTAAAPAGSISHFLQANWTTYSLVRRYISESGLPMFPNSNVFYGPAITAETITGVGAPNPTTSVSRTYASQAGTINAIAFVPLSLTPVTVVTALPNTAANSWPRYMLTIAGGLGTNVSWSVSTPAASVRSAALAGSGDPFSTIAGGQVLASTFALLSSAVVVPTGGQLTLSYTFNGTL